MAAKGRGYAYYAITDHSHYLREGRMEQQAKEIDALAEKVAPLKLLKGVEVNIKADGTLDVPDEQLAQRDWVVASIHTAFQRDPTERVLATMENPNVDCIGHLTGRKLSRRDPMDIDIERVVEKAVETGTFLEINSQPDRLDLSDVNARAGGRGRREGRRLERRAPDRGAGLRPVRHRAGPAGVAWCGSDREHANLGAAEEADEEVSLRADGPEALDWLASYLEGIAERRVLAQVSPGDVRGSFDAAPPERGVSFSEVLRELDDKLVPGLTNWQSPRFFAYFSTTGSEPAALAELLAAGLNQVGILWRTSPALQELEEVTTGWLAELLGLPGGWHGQLEDGASLSTLSALAAAREARAGFVLASEQAHSSVDRACKLLGLELRKVPVDEEFRMRPEALDLDGACAVVATVGTTSTTSVDPVAPISEACAAAGVWLHVDAAYAGCAMVCPEFRWAFEGIEGADSLVVNPHKWLLTPQGCSAFWTRRPDDLRAAFSVTPAYLRTSDEVVSFSQYGPSLGRGFRALSLWAVLRCYGREGLQEVIRRGVRLAELFEGWVAAEPGWELCAPRPFSVVCFRREGSDEENEALLERVNASGEVFLSGTRLHDRFVLRLAVGNHRTTEDDVALAWNVLKREAATT